MSEVIDERKPVIEWVKKAGIRALKTGAEVMLGFLVAGAAFDEIGWLHAFSVTGVAMIASVLISIKGIPEHEDGLSPLKEADIITDDSDTQSPR